MGGGRLEVEDLLRDKGCNLVICKFLVVGRRVPWKVAQFRNFGKWSVREETSPILLCRRFKVHAYQSASGCGRTASHLIHHAMQCNVP